MKKILLSLTGFIFFSAFSFNSSAAEEIDKGIIKGKILDTRSLEPIAYASVALVTETDTIMITGTITDEEGKFQITDVPYGKYKLKINFLGYSPLQVPNIELTRNKKQIDLSEIKLSEDIATLDEAVVVKERLKGEEKIDRTVFTLNDDIRKSSSTGIDVLKHIPSVTVDFLENVTLEGQSDIQFYVDGVLRNKDYVAQLDPQSIDKIELITNPGVKYNADVSGIINIVLKKDQRYGVNGSVKIPIPNPEKVLINPAANIEYGNQNFRIYVGDRMHFERFNGREFLITDLDETFADPFHVEKAGSGKNNWQNNYMNYGFDWFLNDKTSLNLLGEWWNWKGKSEDYFTTMKTFRDDTLSDYSEINKNGLDNNNNYYFSLFLKRKFNKEGNELTGEIYFNQQTGKSDNRFTDSYFNVSNLESPISIIDRFESTNNQKNATEIKIDYTLITGKLKNEMGIRSYKSWTDNNFSSDNITEGIYNDKNEEFKYQESRQIVYYNLSGTVEKINWQAGISGEYTYIDINETATNDYFTFLPQFSISRNLNKEQNLKFSYRKMIRRPGINVLNPFETWTDSLHFRHGNPQLKPTIENRLDLTYSKNFKNNFVSSKLYYRYSQNGIQDLSIISPEGITEIAQANIGEEKEYGLELNSALQIFKRLRINGNLALYNRIMDSEQNVTGNDEEQKFSYRFNISTIVSLPKDFNFTFFTFYGSPRITYQREFSRDLLALIGIDKKFNEKASISCFYNPFVNNFKYTKVKTRTPGYYEQWWGEVDVLHLFSIEFTYKFNYGKKINKINRSAEYEKNQGAGGL